jgi:hypothetical protein
MESLDEADKNEFFYILGSPYKTMCKMFSLKIGVLIICTFDIIFGVVGFFWGIVSVIEIFLYDLWCLGYILQFSRFVVYSFAIPFSVMAMKGCFELDYWDIERYYDYKMVELFYLVLTSLLISFTDETRSGSEGLAIFNVSVMISWRLGLLFVVKVIWSAAVRLKYGQFMLFMYGEEDYDYIRINR